MPCRHGAQLAKREQNNVYFMNILLKKRGLLCSYVQGGFKEYIEL